LSIKIDLESSYPSVLIFDGLLFSNQLVRKFIICLFF